MKKVLGLSIVLAFAVAPTFAQQVHIDYAHDFDFSTVKTFQYVATEESDAKDPLMGGRIKDAIIRELVEGGLEQVDSDPDLFVTYHLATQDRQSFNTTSMGMGGWGGGWGAWGGGMGMGTSTTTVNTYTEGTLVLDGYDAKEKKMVWRGTGTVTIKAKPEKQTQQINKILAKMGSRWDKILKNKGE